MARDLIREWRKAATDVDKIAAVAREGQLFDVSETLLGVSREFRRLADEYESLPLDEDAP